MPTADKPHYSFWLTVSVVVNAVALLGLALVAIVSPEDEADRDIGGVSLNETIEELRRSEAGYLAEDVAEIKDKCLLLNRKRRAMIEDLRDKEKLTPEAYDYARTQMDEAVAFFKKDRLRTERVADMPLPEIHELAKELEERGTSVYEWIMTATLAGADAGVFDRERLIEQHKGSNVNTPLRSRLDVDLLTGPVYTVSRRETFYEEIKKLRSNVRGVQETLQQQLAMVQRQEEAGTSALTIGGPGTGGAVAGSTLYPWEEIDTGREIGIGENVRPVPSNRLSSEAIDGVGPNELVYINTWYILGPFDNPGRRALTTKFVGEQAVDLDAEYVGKPIYDNETGREKQRTIRWRLVQQTGTKPLISPPHAVRMSIFYAYAEVWVDEPGEYWMFMGGDDYCEVTVNGERIWSSGTIPKPWNPFEHSQPVELQRGKNRILFRLENAGGTTGFSVMLYAKPIND